MSTCAVVRSFIESKTTELQTLNVGFTSEVSDYLVVHTGPEWCLSSMIYSKDTPFWSETLDMIPNWIKETVKPQPRSSEDTHSASPSHSKLLIRWVTRAIRMALLWTRAVRSITSRMSYAVWALNCCCWSVA